MSRLQLQPVASPLDVFRSPEVRAEASGTGLLQLGEALSDFVPALRRYTELRHRAETQEAAAEAERIYQTRRFANMAALKEATEKGEIRRDANPWTYTFLQQLTAKGEVREAALQWQQEYESNPDVKYSDGPKAVEEFLDERIGAMFQGRSAFEAEVMGPEATEFRHAFIANHLNRRSKERDVETETNFRRDIQGFLQHAAARGFLAEQSEPLKMSDRPEGWDAHKERAFQEWFEGIAKDHNLDPDPDNPEHHYNYRAAFAAGEGPGEDGHLPSRFKDSEHPHRFVDGQDTILTGQPDISDILTKIQGTIDTADKQAAIHPDVIRKWAVGAVVDSAVAYRSPELAERVLGGLHVEGRKLTETLPPGGMEEIRSTIAKKALEEFELEAAKERHDTDRAFKAALSTFDKWKTANPGASPFDQDAVDVADLDPQVRVRFQAWLNRVAADDAARVLGDALGTELAGDATPQSRASVTALLFALHQPGTVAQYRDLQRMMASDQWGNLTPTDAGDLMKVLFDGAKSPAEKYTFLESLAKTNRISQSDFQNYAPLAFRGVGDEISTGLWRNTANSLESQITAAWVQDQRLDGSPESKAEMDAVVGQAHRELGEAFLRFRSEKPNATFDEMSTFLNQQLDTVAGRNGGWTSERLQTGAAFITTRLRYETDPSLPGWQPPEVGPDLRWRDGKFIYSSGNITQPVDKPLRLFSDLDDWKKRRSDVGLRLGIEGEYTPERWRFYAEQAKMIGPEAERQALEDLLSFTLLKEDLDLRRDKLARIDPMIETLKSSLRKEQQRRKTENPGLSRTVFEQSLMWSIEQHEQRRDELRRGVKVREAQDGVGL